MKKEFVNEGNVKSTLIRDPHSPNELYVKTDIDDSKLHEDNQKKRDSGLLRHGAKNEFQDGGETIYWFKFDPMTFSISQRKYPDLWKQVTQGRDEAERLSAARKLQFLYPKEVVIYDGLGSKFVR